MFTCGGWLKGLLSIWRLAGARLLLLFQLLLLLLLFQLLLLLLLFQLLLLLLLLRLLLRLLFQLLVLLLRLLLLRLSKRLFLLCMGCPFTSVELQQSLAMCPDLQQLKQIPRPEKPLCPARLLFGGFSYGLFNGGMALGAGV